MGDILKRRVDNLLSGRNPYDHVIALTDVYTGSNPPEFPRRRGRQGKDALNGLEMNRGSIPMRRSSSLKPGSLPYWSRIQATCRSATKPAPGADPERVNHGNPPSETHRDGNLPKTWTPRQTVQQNGGCQQDTEEWQRLDGCYQSLPRTESAGERHTWRLRRAIGQLTAQARPITVTRHPPLPPPSAASPTAFPSALRPTPANTVPSPTPAAGLCPPASPWLSTPRPGRPRPGPGR